MHICHVWETADEAAEPSLVAVDVKRDCGRLSTQVASHTKSRPVFLFLPSIATHEPNWFQKTVVCVRCLWCRLGWRVERTFLHSFCRTKHDDPTDRQGFRRDRDEQQCRTTSKCSQTKIWKKVLSEKVPRYVEGRVWSLCILTLLIWQYLFMYLSRHVPK